MATRRKPYVAPKIVILPTTMVVSRPRWKEFLSRMEGKEGCNFREDPKKLETRKESARFGKPRIVWNCEHTLNIASRLLRKMGFDVESSLTYFRSRGGYCDCEVLFNVPRRRRRGRQRRRIRKKGSPS